MPDRPAAGDTGLADPPLRGLRVAVTREEEPGGPLASAVARRGARTLDWQAVRTVPPEHPAPLCAALERLAGYDWLVFTSARAVAAVAELVAAPVSGPRVAAVGRATAEAARAAGWEVDVVPAEETGTALVVALREAGLGPGSRVLLPISALGSDTVPAGLRGLGATVDRVTAYRTVPADLDRAACAAAIEGAEVDVVAVASPSAVRSLATRLGDELFRALAARVAFAAIGPVTAEAARRAGAATVIEAAEASFEGLAEAIVAWRTGEGKAEDNR